MSNGKGGVCLIMPRIGARIAAARQRAGFMQTALAREVGIARTYLSALEHGRETPSLDLLLRVAQATGTTVAALVAPDDVVSRPVQPYEIDAAIASWNACMKHPTGHLIANVRERDQMRAALETFAMGRK